MTQNIIEAKFAYERSLTMIFQKKLDIIFKGKTISSVECDKYREDITFVFTDGTVCSIQSREEDAELDVFRRIEP